MKASIMQQKQKGGLIPSTYDAIFSITLKVVITTIILITLHIIARSVSTNLINVLKKRNQNKKTNISPSIVGTIVYWLIFGLGLMMTIMWAGIQVSAIITVIGSIALTLALGLQGTINDLASGLMLLATMPFQVGDHIQTADGSVRGKVEDFTIFYTRINDENGGIIVNIPNRLLYGSVIINHTSKNNHTDVLEISISNKNKNLTSIISTLEQALQHFPGILPEPRVKINVVKITPLATVLEARFTLLSKDFVINGTTNKQAEIMSFIRQQLLELKVELPDISGAASIVCKSDKNEFEAGFFKPLY